MEKDNTAPKKVLIVEDQFAEANNLRLILRKAGYDVLAIARSVPEALKTISLNCPDLVLIDIILKTEQTGIELGAMLKDRNIAFIYLSANSDPVTFREVKKTGPYGFLVKPFRERDVLAMLDIANDLHAQRQSILASLRVQHELGQSSVEKKKTGHIIGNSERMRQVLRMTETAGSTVMPVLILGESGTGKELIAKAIHEHSDRSRKPMIVVDCGALPSSLVESELFGHEKGSFTGAVNKRIGKFEQAHEGTIFLDEIGELSPDMQVKFLRVLQQMEICPIGGKVRTVNVRVIAATNRDLEKEVAAGRFRLDLYYRLNVFPIVLPPLRDRHSDILPLAEHFLRFFATREKKVITGFASNVRSALLNYQWPGNVRELENLVARSVLLTEGTRITSFPLASAALSSKMEPDIKTIAENERDHILLALEACNWKLYGKGGAAEILDINGSTLRSRMKKLGIDKKPGTEPSAALAGSA